MNPRSRLVLPQRGIGKELGSLCTVRPHNSFGQVTPHDVVGRRRAEIYVERDRQLEETRHKQQLLRVAISASRSQLN
jgi:hypothetical protein